MNPARAPPLVVQRFRPVLIDSRPLRFAVLQIEGKSFGQARRRYKELLTQLLRERESSRGVHFTDNDLVWARARCPPFRS